MNFDQMSICIIIVSSCIDLHLIRRVLIVLYHKQCQSIKENLIQNKWNANELINLILMRVGLIIVALNSFTTFTTTTPTQDILQTIFYRLCYTSLHLTLFVIEFRHYFMPYPPLTTITIITNYLAVLLSMYQTVIPLIEYYKLNPGIINRLLYNEQVLHNGPLLYRPPPPPM